MKNIFYLFLLLLIPLFGCNGTGQNPAPHDGTTAFPLHQNITATFFWIGEPGTAENGFIPNLQSVWDDQWQDHFGGVDDPEKRNGFFPAGFIPQENPFYAALPYNDFDNSGNRKANASSTIPWADSQSWGPLDSMCKNRWVKIYKGNLVAFAQWEDAGPFGEDDANYVFGMSPPLNTLNDHAGIDVSPAVRDTLKLADIDQVDWQFVEAKDVSDGPWKQVVTTRQVSWD